MVRIDRVVESKDRLKFIKFPWEIYRGDPNWVPPLILDMKKMLDPRKHPFYQHSKVDFFLARRDDRIVGRIAAILNRNHNRFHDEKTVFFGFFESIDDSEVAAALLNRVEDWARDEGMRQVRGPANFSTNETCAFLVDGYDSPPVVMMPYNPPYYVELMEKEGYTKSKDLHAYYMDHSIPMGQKVVKTAQAALQDGGLTIRGLNMRDFDSELERVKIIYNAAWQSNWGFVPMTDAEFEFMAKDLKPVVDPDLVLMAEVEGEPAGFSLVLPNFNQVLGKINGRLLPFGIFRLLLGRRRIDSLRVLTLGVVPKYRQSRAIAPAFYERIYEVATRKGYFWGEFSWVLEDNKLMVRALRTMGARHYKTYRIYEKELVQ